MSPEDPKPAPLASHLAAPGWPRTCRCGEVWSQTEWPELPPIGRYLAGGEGWLELRTCVCGATLVTPVSALASGDAPV